MLVVQKSIDKKALRPQKLKIYQTGWSEVALFIAEDCFCCLYRYFYFTKLPNSLLNYRRRQLNKIAFLISVLII